MAVKNKNRSVVPLSEEIGKGPFTVYKKGTGQVFTGVLSEDGSHITVDGKPLDGTYVDVISGILFNSPDKDIDNLQGKGIIVNRDNKIITLNENPYIPGKVEPIVITVDQYNELFYIDDGKPVHQIPKNIDPSLLWVGETNIDKIEYVPDGRLLITVPLNEGETITYREDDKEPIIMSKYGDGSYIVVNEGETLLFDEFNEAFAETVVDGTIDTKPFKAYGELVDVDGNVISINNTAPNFYDGFTKIEGYSSPGVKGVGLLDSKNNRVYIGAESRRFYDYENGKYYHGNGSVTGSDKSWVVYDPITGEIKTSVKSPMIPVEVINLGTSGHCLFMDGTKVPINPPSFTGKLYNKKGESINADMTNDNKIIVTPNISEYIYFTPNASEKDSIKNYPNGNILTSHTRNIIYDSFGRSVNSTMSSDETMAIPHTPYSRHGMFYKADGTPINTEVSLQMKCEIEQSGLLETWVSTNTSSGVNIDKVLTDAGVVLNGRKFVVDKEPTILEDGRIIITKVDVDNGSSLEYRIEPSELKSFGGLDVSKPILTSTYIKATCDIEGNAPEATITHLVGDTIPSLQESICNDNIDTLEFMNSIELKETKDIFIPVEDMEGVNLLDHITESWESTGDTSATLRYEFLPESVELFKYYAKDQIVLNSSYVTPNCEIYRDLSKTFEFKSTVVRETFELKKEVPVFDPTKTTTEVVPYTSEIGDLEFREMKIRVNFFDQFGDTFDYVVDKDHPTPTIVVDGETISSEYIPAIDGVGELTFSLYPGEHVVSVVIDGLYVSNPIEIIITDLESTDNKFKACNINNDSIVAEWVDSFPTDSKLIPKWEDFTFTIGDPSTDADTVATWVELEDKDNSLTYGLMVTSSKDPDWSIVELPANLLTKVITKPNCNNIYDGKDVGEPSFAEENHSPSYRYNFTRMTVAIVSKNLYLSKGATLIANVVFLNKAGVMVGASDVLHLEIDGLDVEKKNNVSGNTLELSHSFTEEGVYSVRVLVDANGKQIGDVFQITVKEISEEEARLKKCQEDQTKSKEDFESIISSTGEVIVGGIYKYSIGEVDGSLTVANWVREDKGDVMSAKLTITESKDPLWSKVIFPYIPEEISMSLVNCKLYSENGEGETISPIDKTSNPIRIEAEEIKPSEPVKPEPPIDPPVDPSNPEEDTGVDEDGNIKLNCAIGGPTVNIPSMSVDEFTDYFADSRICRFEEYPIDMVAGLKKKAESEE